MSHHTEGFRQHKTYLKEKHFRLELEAWAGIDISELSNNLQEMKNKESNVFD